MKRPSLFRILLSMVLNHTNTPTLAPATPPSVQTQHPLPDDREGWKAYWTAQDQPWRTEPEIDDERKIYLTERRIIIPDKEQGISPFKDIKLSRADVEWLLATHESGGIRGPVDWSDESQRNREGLDLAGADVRNVNLRELPLSRMNGFGWARWKSMTDEHMDLLVIHLEGANLNFAHLEGANLFNAYLEGANAYGTRLEEALLSNIRLQRASLNFAHLERASLISAHLEKASLKGAHLQGANIDNAHLQGAILSEVFFDCATQLNNVVLSDEKYGGVSIVDIRWGDVNIAVMNWGRVKMLGDEFNALQKKRDGQVKSRNTRLEEYEVAVRANRQLAVALQSQGLNEDAARFAYRAQVLQRKVLWKQRSFWKWFGSVILAVLAGYGYRIWRIIAAYLIIISVCAAAYFILGMYYSPHISLSQAFLESITAFHGRVFYELFNPNQPQIWVTAFEAVAGLIVEGVFIAMLAQRFFGK